ncbi:MAG: GAF domain-containing protein [Minicystis sp.]
MFDVLSPPPLDAEGLPISHVAQDPQGFSAWAESAPFGVCLLDEELRFVACNAGLAAIGGKTREALIGRPLGEALPETPAEVLPLLRRALSAGEATMSHEIVVRPNGKRRCFVIDCFRVALAPGRRGVGVAVAEVTARREAQEHVEVLLATKEMLDGSLDPQVTAERLASFLVALSADWCVVDLAPRDGSPAITAIAHVEPEKVPLAYDLRGRYQAREDATHGFHQVMRTGRPELYAEVSDDLLAATAQDPEHLRLLRAVGVRSVMIVPLIARGRTIGALTLVRGRSDERYDRADMALCRSIAARAALAIDNARLYRAEQEARRRAEQAIARVKRLQEVATALSEAPTPERVATIVLRHALDALGAARGVVMALGEDGRTLEALAVSGSTKPGALRRVPIESPIPLAAAFRAGAPQICESGEVYRARFPDHFASPTAGAIVAIPLILSAGRSIGAFSAGFDEPRRFTAEERDFLIALGRQGAQALERARLHEAERRARLFAEEANRAKDEFLGVVSHELRTPLNAVMGWANLLLGKAPDGSLLDKGIRVIERNARAQAKIIDDILDVSRIVTGKLKLDLRPTDVESALRAAVDVVRPTAESKGVELSVRVPEDIPEVAGDPERLQQIFWNLLANAVKFTPAGGHVEAALAAEDGSVVAMVTDTGEGISTAFLPFVFDRFRQADASTSRRHGGLGLGLAIVRHLVEMHGGQVSAESDGPGRGARFTVSLPLPGERSSGVVLRSITPASGLEASNDLTVPPLDGLRVLIVDDEPDARDVMAAVLGRRGAIVEVAGSTGEALAAVTRFHPDVVLTDLGMPVDDGFSLLTRLRALPAPFGRIPAVALTAYARTADAVRARTAGFAAHVAKPADPNLLSVVLMSAAGKLPVKAQMRA